ncbi:MAG TPA: hypothetical protein VGS16_05170 [Candidatus Dormibacteraeota bacterium]|nr:hypothetical protein [Candidatus Dormibacteraeota bacterium]
MRATEEIDQSAQVLPRAPPHLSTLSLARVPIPAPQRSGWLSFARTLRAQTVGLFMLLVVFASSAMVTAVAFGMASDSTQREQVQLITWRYETARANLAAEELRTNLAKMNNAQLNGDVEIAKSYQFLAVVNIGFIESEISMISALNLPSDSKAVITKDAAAFNTFTAFARQFIATGRHTDSEMLVQVDGALNTWRVARDPVDAFINTKIQENQALNDARKASTRVVTSLAAIGTAVLLCALAFYLFHLTLRPVIRLVGVAHQAALALEMENMSQSGT